MSAAAALDTVEGVVQSVNDRGVKVNGTWYNYSKFGDPLPKATRGQYVILTIEDDKFIKTQQFGRGGGGGAPAPQPLYPPVDPATPDRDRMIARQVALKAAVDFLSAKLVNPEPVAEGTRRPAIKADHIFDLAHVMEDWLTRPVPTAEDNS